MTKILAIFFCLLLLPGFSSAEELHSRYGVISASPVPGTESRFKIEFEGKEIAAVEADEVSLYRVKPQGVLEFIVIEKWNPGLNCHYEYLLVAIRKDKTTQLSPSFGECHQLSSARYVRNGVQLVLVSTGPSQDTETFRWVGGKLTKH